MGSILKELKECRVALRIIRKKRMVEETKVDEAYRETEELIAIVAKSIITAKKNNGL